jgi:hypothetical protein
VLAAVLGIPIDCTPIDHTLQQTCNPLKQRLPSLKSELDNSRGGLMITKEATLATIQRRQQQMDRAFADTVEFLKLHPYFGEFEFGTSVTHTRRNEANESGAYIFANIGYTYLRHVAPIETEPKGACSHTLFFAFDGDSVKANWTIEDGTADHEAMEFPVSDTPALHRFLIQIGYWNAHELAAVLSKMAGAEWPSGAPVKKVTPHLGRTRASKQKAIWAGNRE